MPFGIMVAELSITDFEFSPDFSRAIESRQIAEQLALKAKRDLDRIKVEEQMKTIEKLDGHLPNVTGGAVPFVSVGAMREGKHK